MDQYWLPFGPGSRACIGRSVALMELSTLVPQLVRRFDFELAIKEPNSELQYYNRFGVKHRYFNCEVSVRS